MAPRKQAKRAASESVVAASNGNATSPKKRKTAVKSAATNEPKQTKSKRQAKAENEVGSGPASPPKKSRGKQKNAASPAKNNTTKGKKIDNKQPEDTTVKVEKGKRARGGKTVTAKKETQTAAVKPKAKAPAAKKQKTQAMDEADVGNAEQNIAAENPVKKTRRVKATKEESDAATVTQPTARVPRKRKNVDTGAITQEVQEKLTEEVKAKKPRSRVKKVENGDALTTTSKGRSKKNPATEVKPPPPGVAKIKKQNVAVQKDNSKTKNVKSPKKGNAKKAAPRKKLNVVVKKADKAQAEATSEVDVKENGEAHMELKQKKRNAGKANAAMNGKVETKGKQKKGQATVFIDAKEDVIAENKTTEMNVSSEVDENDIAYNTDVTLSDDTILVKQKEEEEEEEEEENKINQNEADSMKDESNISDTSLNKTEERSGSFLCL